MLQYIVGIKVHSAEIIFIYFKVWLKKRNIFSIYLIITFKVSKLKENANVFNIDILLKIVIQVSLAGISKLRKE